MRRRSPSVSITAIALRLHELWDDVLDSNRWTEGELVRRLEAAWTAWNGLPSVATSSWAGAAMAALEFCGVRGEAVLCPSNTFMATPLSVLKAGARAGVRGLQSRRPLRLVRGLRGEGRAAPAEGGLARPHRRPHRVRGRADRRLLPRARHLPDRGLRPRPRRRAGTAAGRGPGATPGVYSLYATKTISTGEGGVLVSRHPTDRVRPRVPQLRQARLPGRGPEPPDERVHGGDRAGSDRAARGDRRLEERGRSRAPRPALPGPRRAARRDGLRPLQVRRLRADRALHGSRLRRALPPHPRRPRRPAEHRLGRRRTTRACRSTTTAPATARWERLGGDEGAG